MNVLFKPVIEFIQLYLYKEFFLYKWALNLDICIQAIDPGPEDSSIDLTDPKQWESKTLASAIKQYLR